jgi:hypothetical protein
VGSTEQSSGPPCTTAQESTTAIPMKSLFSRRFPEILESSERVALLRVMIPMREDTGKIP